MSPRVLDAPHILRPPGQKPPLGATINPGWSGVHTDGRRIGEILAGYWLLNEGSGQTALNFAGGSPGTLVGGSTWEDTNLRFNGTTGYVNCGDPYRVSTGSATLMIQVRVLVASVGGLLSYSTVGSVSRLLSLDVADSSGFKMQLQLYDGSNNPYVRHSSAITANAWYHVVGVRDAAADKLRLFLNGVQSGTDTTDTTGDLSAGSQALYISRRPDTGTYTNTTVAYAALFNVPLSVTAIRAWTDNPYPAGMFIEPGLRIPYGTTSDAAPNGFSFWQTGEILPYLSGKSSTTGFDYWSAGEVFPAGIVVAAAPPATGNPWHYFAQM